MKNKKVTDTEKSPNPEWLLGSNPNAIVAQEAQGQKELVDSMQLPLKCNGKNAMVEYGKMGITVAGFGKSDELFGSFILPTGWRKEATDHDMWSNLVDNKDRVRAEIFYKASFYDRDASVNFKRRFRIKVISFLPTEEQGHYEMETIKNIPNADSRYGIIRVSKTEKQKVWVKKYKDFFDEKKHTPIFAQVLDGEQVILESEKSFFTEEHTEANHSQWFANSDAFEKSKHMLCENYLNEKYPDWKNIHAYWNHP